MLLNAKGPSIVNNISFGGRGGGSPSGELSRVMAKRGSDALLIDTHQEIPERRKSSLVYVCTYMGLLPFIGNML